MNAVEPMGMHNAKPLPGAVACPLGSSKDAHAQFAQDGSFAWPTFGYSTVMEKLV